MDCVNPPAEKTDKGKAGIALGGLQVSPSSLGAGRGGDMHHTYT